ncbi:MAG: hypothetical protein GY765_36325 [bacterium]|nr:hypothetical protein [bacterium]
MCKKTITAFVFIWALSVLLPGTVSGNPGDSGDSYYCVVLNELKITKGELPVYDAKSKGNHHPYRWFISLGHFMEPYAVGKNGEEIYCLMGKSNAGSRYYYYSEFIKQIPYTVLHIRGKGKPSGIVYVPNADLNGLVRLEFEVTEATARKSNGQEFLEAKEAFYKKRQDSGIPGTAWFRHLAIEAKYARTAEANKKKSISEKERVQAERREQLRRGLERMDAPQATETKMERTYSLFSGGRALSENLQLDRRLRITPASKPTIAIDSLKGITTAEMDWKKEIAGQNPKKDALARNIPSDQYALFFHSFQAMIDLVDELDNRGTPVLQVLEPRSEDALTRERYQKQLILPTSKLSKILGPKLVSSVAFTGSDPYLRTGTDLAVLFSTKNKKLLTAALSIRRNAATVLNQKCRKLKGTIKGISYSGLVTPDRSVSSYMAELDDTTVVVTNSLFQLKQLAGVAAKGLPSIDSLDEFTFFRNRYKIKEGNEVAFLVLTDATIRKWCSPRWRIGDSRRTRVAAAMAELQAEHLDGLASGKIRKKSFPHYQPVPGTADLEITSRGVRSKVYGTLDFLTPISELPMDKVTKEEAAAYEWFRTNYQKHWRHYFDPIGARVSLKQKKVGVDITVRPLIVASDYRSMIEVAGNSVIRQDAGDPHPESLFHYVLALDPQSPPIKKIANMTTGMMPQLGTNALNWIGKWVTFYVDNDPLWRELEKVYASEGEKAMQKFMEKNFNRFPAALVVEASNSLKLTLFLSGLRAFVQQAAPGLVEWESLKYKDFSYVRISSVKKNTPNRSELEFELFYVPTPDSLMLTLSKNVLHKYIDRVVAGKKGKSGQSGSIRNWLGESMCMRVRNPILSIFRLFYKDMLKYKYQQSAWSNIPILNEWRRNFGRENPLEFHRKYWQTRLLCPGGGTYVWNPEFNTMESTIFGHPGQPKQPDKSSDPLFDIIDANLGVTFESSGLRARGELTRK